MVFVPGWLYERMASIGQPDAEIKTYLKRSHTVLLVG
jgi:hypothetical protein